MKIKKYKGYILEFSKPSFGFFSSGRGGKVLKKVWSYPESIYDLGGFWANSESEAKKKINKILEETK